MQTTPTKRKTVRCLLETGAGAAANDMKEKYIMYESKPAASTAFSKARRTATSKLFKKMTPSCSLYEAYFRNLVEAPEPGAGENLSKQMDLFWSTLCTTYGGIKMMTTRTRMCSVQTI